MTGKNEGSGLPARILGRGFLIAIVVIFSSLSFTLGFFVGKSLNQATDTINPGQETSGVTSLQFGTELGNKPLSESSSLHQTEKTQSDTPIEGEDPSKVKIQTVGEIQDQGVHSKDFGSQSKVKRHTPMQENKPAPVPSPELSKAAGPKVTYTVQLGALKSASQARDLKSKLERKGYKTFIRISEGENREKIYKIRTGMFSEKKDAEMLSLQINKNEGLTSFITIADE